MEEKITLAHGAGGEQTAQLIDRVFKNYFDSPLLTSDDAAYLPAQGARLAMSTDGFIVSPPFFSGGNIGKLSVCGTVNDLSCMGAKPLYLTAACVIEEGFLLADLEKIAEAMAKTAKEAGVQIVAGDTKVAAKGQVDKIFITTTGIGAVLPGVSLGGAQAHPGDAVIVTGDIGRHGCCILLERDDFGISADVESDCAPLWDAAEAALGASSSVHVIRDATRGGVGTVLYEIAAQSGTGIVVKREQVPVQPAVSGVCSLLGLDPMYLACEGRMVMIVPGEDAEAVLEAVRRTACGADAVIIGSVTADYPGRVIMETAIGTKTILPKPAGELLPRIC